MNYYGTSYWAPTDSLSHHGILGQKWGKKNGPPYPLGSNDHSSSEKKAGWRKSLSEKRKKRKEEKKKKVFRETIDSTIKKNPGKLHGEISKKIATDEFKKAYITSEQINRVVSAKQELEKYQQQSIEEKATAREVQNLGYKLLDNDFDGYCKRAIDEDVKAFGSLQKWKEEYGYDPYEMYKNGDLDYWVYNDAMDIAYYDAAKKYPEFRERLDKVDRAVDNYTKVCRDVTNEIIAKYGDEKVKADIYGSTYSFHIGDIIYQLDKNDL